MTPNRPYLLRSLYEWIMDNNMTPYIILNAEQIQTDIPEHYIDGGKLVLNIHPSATRDLVIGNESIIFKTRFGGKSYPVESDINSVIAIYSRESGKGMIFPDEEENDYRPDSSSQNKRPDLKVIK